MTITKTIGVGAGLSSTPDYSTAAGYKAYIEAKSGSFTDNEELVFLWTSSANEIVDSFNITCDTGAYRIIFRAETGKSFRDNASKSSNALRYNASNGACIRSASTQFLLTYARCSFIGLQIKATSYVGSPIYLSYTPGGHIFSNNILQCDDNGFYSSLHVVELHDPNGNAGITFENNVIASRGYPGIKQNQAGYSGTITLTGNTIYNYGNTSLSPTAFAGLAGGAGVFYNNAVAGFSTDCSWPSVSGSHNATDQATGSLPSTSRQNSLVASTEWENVSAGTLDFRLKTGSVKCKDLGTASFGLNVDILGLSRSGATDIGAYEFGGTSSSPQITVTGNGNSITDGDATPSATDHTDFGSITQGGATVSRTFTVANPGTATLNISSVTVPTGYTKTTDLPSTIAASANAGLIVRLDNSVVGTKSGDITINSDATPAVFNFAVTGVVAAPPPPPPPPPPPSGGLRTTRRDQIRGTVFGLVIS